MGAVFVKILNMGLTAGWIALAVLLVRLLLKKKAPKALFPILWALVAVRLVCPVTLESNFSLIRNPEPVEQTELPENFFSRTEQPSQEIEVPVENNEKLPTIGGEDIIPGIEENIPVIEPVHGNNEELLPPETSLPGPEFVESNTENPENAENEIPISDTDTSNQSNSTENKTGLSNILAIIWLFGTGVMLLYIAISYFRIYRQVAESAPLTKNVRICDRIESPFILGVIRPKIYLPSDIGTEDREYVLAHERAHIKRLDHFWKPLGFILLSVYWFHPLLWVAYIVLCKDIEYACDEKVIKTLGQEQKKTYSTALINCSVQKKLISACPLAFGETGVKGRVKSVLHYKKPAFWIVIASVVICTILAVCFLTNPLKESEPLKSGDIITFGTYEQDNVTLNGTEPIEWIVLDVFDGKATLLSKYGLDAKPYDDGEQQYAFWAECSLREWLNGEFFENAFSQKERKVILNTRLENISSEKYGHSWDTFTEDKVYLLSRDELLRVFESEQKNGGNPNEEYVSKTSITTATAYAKAQGVWEKENEEEAGCGWILRTPAEFGTVTKVTKQGTLSYDTDVNYSGTAIRPAIRIELSDAKYQIIKENEKDSQETQAEEVYTRSARFSEFVPLEEAKPGYMVQFGQYAHGYTYDIVELYSMEWYVLDVKEGKALLLSRHVLNALPYHERTEQVNWEKSTLREWLNSEFIDRTFTEEEEQRIVTSLVENAWNPRNTSAQYEYTLDKVFLPSVEDAEEFFQTDTERMATWAGEQPSVYGEPPIIPYAGWWLRASSEVKESESGGVSVPYFTVAGINYYGALTDDPLPVTESLGVRPMLWVEIGNSEEKDEKVSKKLPEPYEYKEIKDVFSEYLNHQAYLYPGEYPQEQYDCTYDVYCTKDSSKKRVYLKVLLSGKESWYLCTPTEYLEENDALFIRQTDKKTMELLLDEDAITYLKTDTVKVPAVSKPEYQKATEADKKDLKESIRKISDVLCQNGYLEKSGYIDVLKLETWISEYDVEKGLLPHAYVIINDSFVYETSFIKEKGLYATFYEDNFKKDFTLKDDYTLPDEYDGRNIRPLSTIDEKQWERVKECATLHDVYEPDFTVTITIDEKEVVLPKHNIEISERYRNGIAFVPIETQGNTTHYNIYYSKNGGKTWALTAGDYIAPAGDISSILIPTRDHIVCYFELNEETKQSQCILSEDSGVTWSVQTQATKPYSDLANASAGSSVIFGSYEQNGDVSDGKEPIEWLVLDRVGDKILLLSRYGLDALPYHGDLFESTTWEDCSLRSRLNVSFYRDAFSVEERALIAKVKNETPDNTQTGISGGNSTEDYVFLLTADEVLYGKTKDGTPYFENAESRIALPTAETEGEFFDSWERGNNEYEEWAGISSEWWLRTPGESEYRTLYVAKDGTVSMTGQLSYSYDYGYSVRPAIWVDVSSLSGKQNDSSENVQNSLETDRLTEEITTTNISIAIGDKYAAYLDEEGKLHVLYDTSYRSDYDPLGATGGIDVTKTYKELGTDPRCLVAIDEEGRPFASYHMNAEELTDYVNKAIEETMAAGGNYGAGGPQPGIAKDFEEMSDVKQIYSTYPYNEYMVLFEDGTVRRDRNLIVFTDMVQFTDFTNGMIAGIKSDGTFVLWEGLNDVIRKKKLESWPEKLKQIEAGYNFFVGLKQDGTVISEGVEQEYLINTIEQWSGIVKIAVGNETVVGLKGDGTVVAVCPGRSDVGQCEVDDWTDVIAVNTNGKVTIGITKSGEVLMAGAVPEVVSGLPERYNYEEIKTLLLEYLNHQAWLFPGEYPQESYTCSYELYRSAKDVKARYVYLKTVINESEHWFSFEPKQYHVPESPVRILVHNNDSMRESIENGSIVRIGSDKIYVPAPTKPAYGNQSDYFKGDISSIYSDLKRNGYRDNLKIEAIVSDFDMDKKLYPYVYLIINDSEVFETSFRDSDAEPLQKMFFYGNYTKDHSIKNTDGWPDVFDGHEIKPLDSVDPVQLERVKACAIFHQIFVKEKTETFLIDGQTIEIDSPNLGIDVTSGTRIAFLPQEAAAGSVYYNIYRSDDSGKSWRMVAEDFSKEEGGIARILIPDKDTIVCWFEISGTTSQSSCIVSEDGGVTWKHAPYASKPNSFTYDPQTSSSVIFGAFEQDGDYNNGKEPLEWLVLERDGDRALLLSKYGIETLLWDKDQPIGAYDVDDLYWMMNRTFYEAAFSADERAALIQTNPIKNKSLAEFPYGMTQYPGYTFLLETDDVLYGQGQDETKYFRTEESRITIPTAYAAQKGAWLDKNVKFTDVAVPWIVTVTGTTDGDFSEVRFARVMPDGSISYEEEAIKDQHVLIRPAIWVDVTKLPKPEWMN